MSEAIRRACSKLVAVPNRGAGRPALTRTSPKSATVLGQVDGVGPGAHDRHPGLFEALGQAQRRLTAELDDHTDDTGAGPVLPLARGVLGVVDLQHVLEREGLEVQPVGGVVVGGHRLGVAVDHHRFEPDRTQRGRGMHTAVVELDALADPVRPGTQDQHLGLLGLRGDLGLGGGVELVAAVVVRRLGVELGRAGVDGLVHRVDAEPATQRAHARLAGQFRSQRGDLAIRQPAVLGPAQQFRVEHRALPAARPAAPPGRRSAR